jgi:HK97 gp10 family phage protein
MSDKTIKGLTKVLKYLEKFGSESKKEVEEITKISSMDIVADAKAFAPKNLGKLAQSIIFTKVGEADYKVVVNSPYGAYVEFGTGAKVRVPAELQDVASQFKGKKGGSFEQGLQGIKDWCKNKGIPEIAAYPIFMSILRKGQEPQPYLYPAFVKGRKQYLKDLKELLKRLTKKYD